MENEASLPTTRISKIDLGIILGSVALLFGSAFFLYTAMMGDGPSRDGEVPLIGQITKVQKDVRLKANEDSIWYDLKKSQSIYLGDTVFTGEGSSALVTLGDKSQINVEPYSLISFAQKDGMTEITLHYGQFDSELEQQAVVVKTPETIQTLTPKKAKIVVRRTKQGSEVKLVSGDAKIKSPSKNIVEMKVLEPIRTKAAQADVQAEPEVEEELPVVKVEEQPIEPVVVAPPPPPPPPAPIAEPPVVLTAPVIENPQVTVTFDKTTLSVTPSGNLTVPVTQPTDLRWQSPLKKPHFEVQFAKDSEFQKILSKQEFESSKFNLKAVPPEGLYWRVRAQEQGGGETWSDFSETARISSLLPAFLDEPAVAKVKETKTGPKALIKVQPLPVAKKYEVQTGPDEENLTTSSFDGSALIIPGAYEKRHVWRARALNGEGLPISQYSEFYNIEFGPKKIIPKKLVVEEPLRVVASLPPVPPGAPGPALKSPSLHESFISFKGSPVVVIFRWMGSPGPTYQLQLSETEDFSTLVAEFSTKKNYHVFSQSLPKKSYYWRVRTQNDSGSSSWSAARDFDVSAGQ